MLIQNDNPFHSLEHDHDPIMVAAHLQSASQSSTTSNVRWRYCTEGIPPIQPDYTTLEQPLNIIALGRTGDGKSSLLNDIIGHPVFKQKTSAKSQTKEIQTYTHFWAPLHPYMHNKEQFGCPVQVIDTPGFGDSQLRDKEFYHPIQQAIIKAANEEGGLHCILMVFKITTNADTVFKSIQALYDLVSPLVTHHDFWRNVLLVFTHVDLGNALNVQRYQSRKVALKSKVNQAIRERYHLKYDLPMLWISTQKFTCGFMKGLGLCDCERGNRYQSDCRRRLFEQVRKRASCPLYGLTQVE